MLTKKIFKKNIIKRLETSKFTEYCFRPSTQRCAMVHVKRAGFPAMLNGEMDPVRVKP